LLVEAADGIAQLEIALRDILNVGSQVGRVSSTCLMKFIARRALGVINERLS